MHQHECRHCRNKFLCSEDADECFARLITCDDCFWLTDFIRFVAVGILLLIAAALTAFVANNWRSL